MFLIPPQISRRLCIKVSESSLAAATVPLLLFSLRGFPKPWIFSQPVLSFNIKVQEFYNSHPMGDKSPWPSILPSFRWTTLRCIPHGSPQSLARLIQLPTAVIRSIMYNRLLLFLVSLARYSAASWDHLPNNLHTSLCLILPFE